MTDVWTLLDAQAIAVQRFVRALSPEDGDAVLAANPGLIDGDYDDVFADLVAAARAHEAGAAADVVAERLTLLATLRRGETSAAIQQLGQIALRAESAAELGV